MEVSTSLTASADMAEALLSEGILRSEDWNGSLAVTMDAGLRRWGTEVFGGDPKYLGLGIIYGDDLSYLTDGPGGFDVAEEDKGSVGGFGFGVDGLGVASIGRTILDIDAVLPRAGVAVVIALDQALHATVGAYTIPRALEMIQEWSGWDDPDEDDGDRLTPDNFYRVIPAEVARPYLFKGWTSVMASAADYAGSAEARRCRRLRPRLREAVVAAQEITECVAALEAEYTVWATYSGPVRRGLFCDLSWFGCEPDVPVLVRWHATDMMTHAFDYWNDYHNNDELATDTCYLAGFRRDRPAYPCTSAARRFRLCGELLAKIDHLLSLLHSERPLPRSRARRFMLDRRPHPAIPDPGIVPASALLIDVLGGRTAENRAIDTEVAEREARLGNL